jgi:hypothetical protein
MMGSVRRRLAVSSVGAFLLALDDGVVGLPGYVRTRDKTCRVPGCRQPARRCDLDHLIPFPEGPTSASNLNALCRRHHRLKGEGNWDVKPDINGGLIWKSPAGFEFEVPAEPVMGPN